MKKNMANQSSTHTSLPPLPKARANVRLPPLPVRARQAAAIAIPVVAPQSTSWIAEHRPPEPSAAVLASATPIERASIEVLNSIAHEWAETPEILFADAIREGVFVSALRVDATKHLTKDALNNLRKLGGHYERLATKQKLMREHVLRLEHNIKDVYTGLLHTDKILFRSAISGEEASKADFLDFEKPDTP